MFRVQGSYGPRVLGSYGSRVLRVRVLGFIACARLNVTAAAQTPAPQRPAPPKMEFDAAIKQAVDRNPTVARAATNITRAELLLQQARAVYQPIVSVSVFNSTLDSSRGFAGGTIQPRNQTTVAGNVVFPVLASARWALIEQARDQIAVANAGLVEVRQQISVATADAYLAVIAARRQVEVTERSLDTARQHLDYAQKRLEGGAGSRLNQLRAAQQVSSDEARLEAIRQALRTAQEALGVLVVSDGPVDAGAEPSFEQPGAMDENAWRNARPDLLTQAAVQRSLERIVQDSWKDWVPNVNASFDPSLVTPTGIFAPSRTWRLSLTSTYAVFDGNQRKIDKLNRQLTLDQEKLTMTQLEIEARSEVRLAQETVASRLRALEAARRAAQQAGEVVTITTTAFEVGATTNLEVIDAQRAARDADTVAAIAENALARARLDLLVALGVFK